MTTEENINVCRTLIKLFKDMKFENEDVNFEYFKSKFLYGDDNFIKYDKETDTLIIDNPDLVKLINFLNKEDIERVFNKGIRHSPLSEKNIKNIII